MCETKHKATLSQHLKKKIQVLEFFSETDYYSVYPTEIFIFVRQDLHLAPGVTVTTWGSVKQDIMQQKQCVVLV